MKSINSKRDQFRKDLIKKQRQDLFMQRRLELIKSMQYPQGIINPIQELKQRTKIKESFEFLRKKFNDSDYFANIVKYIDEGLVSTLMGFLRDGIQINEVFETIMIILEKKQPNYYTTFYNHGILEYAFSYFQVDLKSSSLCMYILFLYTSKSDDYCESLIFNNKHHIIMQEFMNRANNSRNPEEENNNQGDKFYTYALFILDNLIKTKLSIDNPEEKINIFKFALMIVEKRLFLKHSLGILYQCTGELERTANVSQYILPHINQLLTQVKTEDNCLYNLFALIFQMMRHTPIELNFPEFFKLGILATKVQKPFLLITERMICYGTQMIDKIPRNEQWWQRLLLSPQSNNLHCKMLNFIEALQIKKEWIWKIYAAALAQSSHQVQNEAISILNRLLRKSGYESNILNYLNLYRIPILLENLTHTAKTQSGRDYANQLLDYILGPMTEQSAQTMI